MEKPQTVSLGVNLLWVSLAISVIASALDPTQIMHKSQSIPVLAVVVLLTLLAVMALLTYKISAGRNWARITFLVLFLFSVAPSLSVLPALLHVSLVAGITNILQSALQLIALVLVFTPSANPWFKKRAE
jgi:hypothetical protein